MKKLIFTCLAIALTVFISGCFETESTTTINKDGSGSIQSSVDFSSVMAMLMAQKKEKEEEVAIDTTIRFQVFTDTATALTARQKELMRNIELRMLFDSKKSACLFSINAPFKSTADLNELNKLMAEKEFDDLFDGAISKTPLGGGEEPDSPGKNDNLFGSVFPSFFDCIYTNNSITCTVNKEKYNKTLADMEKSQMKLDDAMVIEMLESAKFTNKINLPGKPKTIKGDSLKNGEVETTLVQTGNMYEMYKNPEKYAYTVNF